MKIEISISPRFFSKNPQKNRVSTWIEVNEFWEFDDAHRAIVDLSPIGINETIRIKVPKAKSNDY